jgi:hypothetical protein
MYTDHQKYFSSKYPIICAGMNTVSDLKLALAINEAGCTPSFVAYNYFAIIEGKFVYTPRTMFRDLNEYVNKTGNSNFVLGVSTSQITDNEETLEILKKIRPAYIELFDHEFLNNEKYKTVIEVLRGHGIKFLAKVLSFKDGISDIINANSTNLVDGIIIKNNKGAGRIAEHGEDLFENLKLIKSLVPEWIVISQGGISNSEDIREHLDAGADAVSIGTLFAVAEESSISLEAKNKMIEASYSDTERIGTANQNAIVLSKQSYDVENNTIGLRKGIRTGKEGHIFAGAALDHITEILPVSAIIQRLISSL